jgi:hypothetical protein
MSDLFVHVSPVSCQMSRARPPLKRRPPGWKPFEDDTEPVAKKPRKDDDSDSKSTSRGLVSSSSSLTALDFYGNGVVQTVLEDVVGLPRVLSNLVCQYDYGPAIVAGSSNLSSEIIEKKMKTWEDVDGIDEDGWLGLLAENAREQFVEQFMHRGLRGHSVIRVKFWNGEGRVICLLGMTRDAAVGYIGHSDRQWWAKRPRFDLALIVDDYRQDKSRNFVWFLEFKKLYDRFLAP